MFKIVELSNKPIYVLGDIHGDLQMLKLRISNDDMMQKCNIIIAGDIGLGFELLKTHISEYKRLNKFMIERDIHLYLLRGNHDDPSYFNEHLIDSSNIVTLEDYTVLKCENTHILCVGGGISIDRTHRIKRYEQRLIQMQHIYEGLMSDAEILAKVQKGYWEDEAPIYKEDVLNEITESGININYVITHTSPNFAFKKDKDGIDYWLTLDHKLSKDLDEERETLSKVFHKIMDDGHPLKEWVYGHFHKHNSEEILGIPFTALANADYMFDIKPLTLINN